MAELVQGKGHGRSLEATLREEGARLFSGRMDVDTGGIVGVIHMSDGQVLDARLGSAQGEPALWRLLLHEDPRIQLESGRPRATSGTILGHPDALLKRFAERLALLEVYAHKLGGFQRVWSIRYDALAKMLEDLPDAVNPMLRLLDGRRTVRQVVTESALDDVLALRVLGRLLVEGVLSLPDTPAERRLRADPGSAASQGLEAALSATLGDAERDGEHVPLPSGLSPPLTQAMPAAVSVAAGPAQVQTSEPPGAVMPPPNPPPPSSRAEETVTPAAADEPSVPRVVTMMPRDVSVPPDTTLPVVTALPSAPPTRASHEVQSWLGRDDLVAPHTPDPSTGLQSGSDDPFTRNGWDVLPWAAVLLAGVLLGMLVAQKAC